MRYRFYLAAVNRHCPPLATELLNQLDSWDFPEGSDYHIEFHLCPERAKELMLVDWSRLRSLLFLQHQVHPEVSVRFFVNDGEVYRHGRSTCRS